MNNTHENPIDSEEPKKPNYPLRRAVVLGSAAALATGLGAIGADAALPHEVTTVTASVESGEGYIAAVDAGVNQLNLDPATYNTTMIGQNLQYELGDPDGGEEIDVTKSESPIFHTISIDATPHVEKPTDD